MLPKKRIERERNEAGELEEVVYEEKSRKRVQSEEIAEKIIRDALAEFHLDLFSGPHVTEDLLGVCAQRLVKALRDNGALKEKK